MSRPDLLKEEEILSKLSDLHNWESNGKEINREIVASNFAAAVGIVNSVAIIAETLDHHPDILLYGWNKVRITSSTHDKGGLTELDFTLANKIEELNF
jgi:4a-hydroxytetrahydrobiopterin dehydratase